MMTESAADGQRSVVDDLTYDQGADCNNAQINSAEQGDPPQNLLNELHGGLAGTEARNEPALLLQVVGDLHGG